MNQQIAPDVQAFEQEFAAYCQVPHAVGVGDGTTALYLALRACGIGPGDEVITVSHKFVATVEAILLAGASPIFVDIDPQTCTIAVDEIEGRLGPRTKAIVPVHLYGQCADMDPITESVAAEVLSLPMYPELSADQIARVAGEIRAFFSQE